jgi:hypothetical protein
MPNFEVYKRGTVPAGAEPYVTLNKRGVFILNKAAYAEIGRAPAVLLMYAADEKIIGFRPCPEHTPDSYKVHTTARDRTFLVSAKAFTNYYDMPLATSMRYPVYMENGILCLALATGIEVTSNRGSRATRADEEADTLL